MKRIFGLVLVSMAGLALLSFLAGSNGAAAAAPAKPGTPGAPAATPASRPVVVAPYRFPFPAVTTDWPQWRGPQRNNVSTETGLALDWKKTPPTEVWRVNTGPGSSSVIVVGGKLYAVGTDWKKGEDALWCLNADTGRAIWRYAFPSDAYRTMSNESEVTGPWSPGACSTPAFSDGRIYALASDGQAHCLDAATGKLVWHRNLEADGLLGRPGWGHGASPLVMGNLVIFYGGVALDKNTGEVAFKGVPADRRGWSSPTAFLKDGQDAVMVEVYPHTFHALSVPDFKPLWNTPSAGRLEDCMDPVFLGDRVYFFQWNDRALVMRFGDKASQTRWSEVLCGYDTPILYQGHFYSTGGYLGRWLQCFDLEGKLKWKTATHLPWAPEMPRGLMSSGPTFQIMADGKIIVQHETGYVTVHEATPEAYKQIGMYSLAPRLNFDASWTTPALSRGRLYCRMDRGDVVCLDIRQQRPTTQPSTHDGPDGYVQVLPRADRNMVGPTAPMQEDGGGAERGRLFRALTNADKSPLTPGTQPAANDWSQWRGPNHDGISAEKCPSLAPPGWTKGQPKELWRVDVGLGFSSVAAAGDRIYTQGYYVDSIPGERDEFNSWVWCLDARTGRTIWKYAYVTKASGRTIEADRHGNCRITELGPRSTPAIDGQELYVFDQSGWAMCLDAATGKPVWKKNLAALVDRPVWSFSGSPLVLEKAVIFSAGNAGIALDKLNGGTLWLTGREAGGNASPAPLGQGADPLLAIFGSDRLFVLDPKLPQQKWPFPWIDGRGLNRCDAIPAGEGKVLTFGGLGKGAALLAVGNDKPVWEQKALDPNFATPVLYQGYIYGPSETTGELLCVDAKDGTVKWRERLDPPGSPEATQVSVVDGKLLIQCRGGDLRLAEATPAGYTPLGQFRALASAECWTPAVVARGRLLCRSWDGELAAFDLNTIVAPASADPVRVTDDLVASLGSPVRADRQAAVAKLSRVSGDEVAKLLSILTAKVAKGSWFEQTSAAAALARLGPTAKSASAGLVAAANAALEARDLALAQEIIQALQAIDPDALSGVWPALAGALRDAKVEVRRRAVEVVTDIVPPPDPSLVAALTPLISGPDRSLVSTASIALGYMGQNPDPTVPNLTWLIRNPNPRQLAAVRALGAIGPAAQPAVGEMIKAAGKADLVTSQAIQSALRRIRTADAPPVVKDVDLKTTEGGYLQIKLALSDDDDTPDALHLSILTRPTHGTLVLRRTTADYIADYGYTGADSFTWKARDEHSESPVASVKITIASDTDAPSIKSVTLRDAATLTVTFSKPMEKTAAETPANYALAPEAAVTKATLDPTGKVVTLTLGKLQPKTEYTLTAANLHDRALKPNTVTATPAKFQSGGK